MRSLVVVEELVSEQFGGDGLDGGFAVEEVPELDACGAVGAPTSVGIDAAIPLGAPGREDVEFDAELLVCGLESRSAMNGA